MVPVAPLPKRNSDSNQSNSTQDPVAQGQQTQSASAAKQSNTLAVVSLICGGLGFFFGIFTALPAVICGHMALAELRREPDRYESASKGMAIAGLVLGYVFVVLTVLMLVVFGFMIAASL